MTTDAAAGRHHPDEVLRADGLVKRYHGRAAVDGVDLRLSVGEVHGLLGANGAGKSTLLRMLLGLTRPDSGQLEVLGRAGGGGPGVAGFTGSPRFWPGVTARRTLRLLADLDGGRGRESVAEVLDVVGLVEEADRRVDGFSTGMRQRLALAAALLRSPEVLLLDEPATGLDPAGARDLQALLRRLAAAGTTVLLSSHDLPGVADVCDSVTLLRAGRTAWCGRVALAGGGRSRTVLRTSDDAAALRLSAGTRLTAVASGDHLVLDADQDEVDAFVLRLSAAGVVVRLLAPERHPLHALFFGTDGAGP